MRIAAFPLLALAAVVATWPACASEIRQPAWEALARLPPSIAARQALPLVSSKVTELRLEQFVAQPATGITFWTHPRGAGRIGLCEATKISVRGYRRDLDAHAVYKMIFSPPPEKDGPVDPSAEERVIQETNHRCEALTTAQDFFAVGGLGSEFEAWNAARLLGMAVAEASDKKSAFGVDLKEVALSDVTFVQEVRCALAPTAAEHHCYEMTVTGQRHPGGSGWRVLRVDGDERPTAISVVDEGRSHQY